MPNIDRMDIQIRAHDQATSVLNRISNKFGVTTKQGLAMGAMFAGVTMGINTAMNAFRNLQQWITDSIQKYREFNRAMSEVATMLDQTSQKYLPEMTKAIDNLSIVFGKSAVDLARGLYQVLSAGVDASKAVDVLTASSKLATATLTSVETAVDAVTTVLNAYGMQAYDVWRVTDIMAKTIVLGKLRMDELANSLGYVVPLAAQAGVSFEEVSAALATMTKQGINVQMGARGLRQLMNSIIAPTEEQKKAMGELGVAFDDLTLEALGLQGTMKLIKNAVDENNVSMTMLIPNVRAVTAGLALATQDGNLFDNTLQEINDSIGSVDYMLQQVTGSFDYSRRVQEMWSESIDRSLGKAGSSFDKFIGNIGNAFKTLIMHGFNVSSAMDSIIYKAKQVFATKYISDQKQVIQTAAGELKRLNSIINEQTNLVQRLSLRQQQYIYELDKLKRQRDVLVQTHQYTDALHYIPLALEDATYTTRIFDHSVQALVDSIRLQRMEIERLNVENERYNLLSQQNTLDILRIQYIAGQRRGRLTRDEKQRLQELQQANNLLRIKTLENEIQTQQIRQNGLNQEEQRLERIKTMYNEEIRKAKDSYNQELQDYDFLIKQKEILIADYDKYIAQANEKRIEAEQKLTDALLKINTTWSEDMRQLLLTEVSDFITAEQLKVEAARKSAEEIWKLKQAEITGEKPGTTGIPIVDIIKSISGLWGDVFKKIKIGFPPMVKIPFLQGGGVVRETGLAVVHRGETVIPAGKPVSKIHVEPITVNVNISDNADVEHLVQKIELAVQSGLISGVSTTYG